MRRATLTDVRNPKSQAPNPKVITAMHFAFWNFGFGICSPKDESVRLADLGFGFWDLGF
jgi:hypothetical protein